MHLIELIRALDELEKSGRHVFTTDQFYKYFPNEPISSYNSGLARYVDKKLLIRATRGVFVNPRSRYFQQYTLEWIASVLRPQHLVYLSLESALEKTEEFDEEEQYQPTLTVMTTGTSGQIQTPFGQIELITTHKSKQHILERTYSIPEHPLRIATLDMARCDLKSVGRNLHLLEESQLT